MKRYLFLLVLGALLLCVQSALTAGDRTTQNSLAAWRNTDKCSVDALTEFLSRYGESAFAADARRLIELNKTIIQVKARAIRPQIVIPFAKLNPQWEQWKALYGNSRRYTEYKEQPDGLRFGDVTVMQDNGSMTYFDGEGKWVSPTAEGSIICFASKRTALANRTGRSIEFINGIVLEISDDEGCCFGVVDAYGLVHLSGEVRVALPKSCEENCESLFQRRELRTGMTVRQCVDLLCTEGKPPKVEREMSVLREASVDTAARDGNEVSVLREASVHTAARDGNLDAVRSLVENDASLANARNSGSGSRPLHEAAGEGHLEVVRYLLSSGADPAAKDKLGWTPLHYVGRYASGWTPKALLDVLVAAGADVNAGDRRGNTPLHVAVQYENQAAVDLLVSGGANVNAKNSAGETVLLCLMTVFAGVRMEAVPKSDMDSRVERDLKILDSLLFQGAGPNIGDNKGATALHKVADAVPAEYQRAVATKLLTHGANCLVTDNEGKKPVDRAMQHGRDGDLERLLVAFELRSQIGEKEVREVIETTMDAWRRGDFESFVEHFADRAKVPAWAEEAGAFKVAWIGKTPVACSDVKIVMDDEWASVGVVIRMMVGGSDGTAREEEQAYVFSLKKMAGGNAWKIVLLQ